MKTKCTYESCHQHFDSHDAMIKHKKKDPEHAYCRKCDIDCSDDMQLMIHQIESPKHICCPVCGMEFKSPGGRDRHVEVYHASEQRVPCRGCKIVFTRASALMRHIESDECKVITLKDFHRERAERAIDKDAMEQILSSVEGSTIHGSAVTANSGSRSAGDADEGGVSLLESDQPGVRRDWQNQSVSISLQSSDTLSSGRPSQKRGTSITSLSKFPPLAPKSTNAAMVKQPNHQPNSELLDMNEIEQKMGSLTTKDSVWNQPANHSKTLFPSQLPLLFPETDSRYDDLSEISFRTSATGADHASHNYTASTIPAPSNSTTDPIPPSAPPVNLDPNYPHSRISTTSITFQRQTSIDLAKFWDPIREAYECPGTKCLRLYPTPEAFRDHLLSGAHVGGHVTCPSCLNRFRTNSALVSHMESGGRGCNVRNSTNYNQVLREVTAGLIGSSGHLEDGTVRYTAPVDEGWD